MSYNSQIEEFVKGDLVYFTGYQVDYPPLAHKIGIVMQCGPSKHMYDVMWLNTGNIIAVAGKHLTLAYTR